MFERFTDRARSVLVLAQEEARLLNHSFIGTEHLLLGMIREGEGVAARALESLGIELGAIRERVRATITMPVDPTDPGSPPFTPRAKQVLEYSLREALQLGHNYIGTEHLLLGLVREGEGVAAQALRSSGIELSQIRQEVMRLLSGFQQRESQGSVGFSPLTVTDHTFSSAGSPGPRCPGCKSYLVEGAHYRSMTVPPTASGPSPLSVETVFCGQCGILLGMFKA